MEGPQAATAASLLVRWAPAELHVALRGPRNAPPAAVSLPPDLRPLITSLRLIQMRVAPATLESCLQQCQRLHTLDVDACTFAASRRKRARPGTVQALPLLRTFG